MRKLTEDKRIESNESMSESDESIHHIEEMKNIVEQQQHYTAKTKKKRNTKRFYHRYRIISKNIAIRRAHNKED